MLPRIFCLVDETNDLSLVPELARLGIGGFQIRAKAASDHDLMVLTANVLTAVKPYAATVIVNDRVDIALAADADGVHLGRTDLSITRARRLAPELLIGATCRSIDEVRRAAEAGATYVGFGPVFASASKDGLPDPLGPAAIAGATGILPLVAIGGIDASSAKAVIAAGADAVAVIGGIWRHPDPLAAAEELVAAAA